MRSITVSAVVASVLGVASLAPAQQTIQKDLNDLPFQVKDASGNNSAFSGVNHTGSVVFGHDAFSRFIGVFIQASPTDPFVKQNGFTGALADSAMTVVLSNGLVTGGSMSVQLANGDTFTAVLSGGKVNASVLGFSIDITTMVNAFSDADFSGVNVSAWMNSGSHGSALAFKISPSKSGFGYGDVDIFTVPAPASAGLLAIAPFVLSRRRR
jgi:hypothetical protein